MFYWACKHKPLALMQKGSLMGCLTATPAFEIVSTNNNSFPIKINRVHILTNLGFPPTLNGLISVTTIIIIFYFFNNIKKIKYNIQLLNSLKLTYKNITHTYVQNKTVKIDIVIYIMMKWYSLAVHLTYNNIFITI